MSTVNHNMFVEETNRREGRKELKKFAIQTGIGVLISAGVHFAIGYFENKSEDETTDN